MGCGCVVSGRGAHNKAVNEIGSSRRVHQLQRRIRFIVAFTIAYNIVEAVVTVSAGRLASSGALVSFGLDSTIEVASAVAIAWQYSRRDPERWEKPTLRLIAWLFFLLAAYVAVEAVITLVNHREPDHSAVGLGMVIASVIIMPLVSFLERDAGRALGSSSAVADSKQTLVCAYLSVTVLVGLLMDWLFGWWWADPVAALVVAALALHEGKEAWEGESCAASSHEALAATEG
ncbi:cation transporter [Corynebacterium pseudokroppenstedtii]|uniref:cation transporter n=1 Tax=Corynebacterium pseudokroppenstedtii TaxID=2804917 RepID=UPI0029101F6F|nr:cation transporter [Corynebacterium kroppenstedtii]